MLRLVGLRPGEPEVEFGRPDAGRRDRHRDRQPLMGVEPHRPAERVGVRRQRPVNVEVERVVARVALDVVDLDMHLRPVADVEEARQGRRDDDRVAHHDVRLRRPDLVLRPGDRGEPDRAVERRQIEGHRRLAVGVELHHAGEERERRLRRQIAFEVAARVAAGVDGARRALHAVDQHAPEVADLDRELALAEEIGARVRRLEAGQVEDADVDGRHGHPRLLARREAGDLDRQGHRLARLRERRRVERNVELARVGRDAEPGEPDRPARHAPRGDVERPVGQRDRIGARAPVGADRERHDIVAGDEIDVDEALDDVADQRDRRLAGIGRIDPKLRLVAGGVARLVERHDDVVGHVRARRPGPADVERKARLLAVERLDVEPVRAPADRRRELRRRVGADVDRRRSPPASTT